MLQFRSSAQFAFLGLIFAIMPDAHGANSSSVTYSIQIKKIQVCGRTLSRIEVQSADSSVIPMFKNVAIRGSNQTLRLPTGFYDSKATGSERMAVFSSALPALRNLTDPIEPFDVPLAAPDEAAALNELDPSQKASSIYCRKIERYIASLKSLSSIEVSTPVIRVKLGAVGEASINAAPRVVIESPPAQTPPSSMLQKIQGYPLALNCNHLVIYSPTVTQQALELAKYRNESCVSASGYLRSAVNVTALPGYKSFSNTDEIPPGCEGVYFNECFYDPSRQGSPKGFSREALPALYGLSNSIPAGKPYDRIPDVAGLIRAYLRTAKAANPQLKYVVLMGEPDVLPTRFTSEVHYFDSENGSRYGGDEITYEPTDYYFRELVRDWQPTGKWGYLRVNDFVAPPRKANDPNYYDTRKFVWPVAFPFVRSFRGWTTQPARDINRGFTPRKDDQTLAVGRVLIRTSVDADNYLQKLKAWEKAPLDSCRTLVTAADGMFEKPYLSHIETTLGRFQFFGEGFGTGFPKIPSPDAERNDWRASNSIETYQSFGQPDRCPANTQGACIPSDPKMPEYMLPSPKEVITHINRNAFSMWFLGGHGFWGGVGFNTQKFNQLPRRQFSVPGVGVANGDQGFEWLDQIQNIGRNGFVISPACNTADFIGGASVSAGMVTISKRKSLAEYLTTGGRSGGAVGAFMNFDVGWYVSDPLYEQLFLSHLRNQHAAGNRRFGDAMVSVVGDAVSLGIPYEVQNRYLIGDPATIVFSKIDPKCPNSMAGDQTSLDPWKGVYGW